MLNDETELKHYGILRRSGRYPWGSGENPYQRGISFRDAVHLMSQKGMSEAQIAKAFGMNTAQFRATKSISNEAIRKYEDSIIQRLKNKGVSNVAIAERLDISEAKVRARLQRMDEPNQDVILQTADILEKMVQDGYYVDIGEGVENHLGISSTRLQTAAAVLQERGYQIDHTWIEQATNPGNHTQVKIITPAGTTPTDIRRNKDKITMPGSYSDDYGHTFESVKPPKSVDLNRVEVRYGGEGGEKKDGLIELRPGVDDISLGGARYAQVRIKVGEDHFLKGMAVYSNDLPDGVDIVFNTNKKRTGKKVDAFKNLEEDPQNPFKTIVRQRHYIDKDGKRQLSPINIVGSHDPSGKKLPGEEGAWSTWSKKLSSQMLSKQPRELAKQQLDLYYDIKLDEYKDIMALTNPAVRKRLLQSYSDSIDAAANKLQAAALPRTSNHVLLPVNSLKDDEIFAPNYRPGEKVALIRHPHGGIFEIPILTVNNKNKEALSFMNQAVDAVGINYKVAQQLSGADFDGDTVLVIPTKGKNISSEPMLKDLKNFDPMIYKNPTLPEMSEKTLQREMGDISNLITDMTIKGASIPKITKAVKHSMVVIDSRKHGLDYKQSAIDNDIAQLKRDYQGGANRGASTIISRSDSDLRVPHRKERSVKDGGPIDKETGRKVYTPTNRPPYLNKQGNLVYPTTKTTRMAEARDAKELLSDSPTKIEVIYANHANKLKALANTARKAMVNTPNLSYSPAAKQKYQREVDSLVAKLNIAKKNKPVERQAQIAADISVKQKRAANPELTRDDIKKLKASELARYRERLGAKRQNIQITPKEWEAIQAGAISNKRLNDILSNTDLDLIKQYALPRTETVMGASMLARAKAMLANGYTQADIADALGVSASTINRALSG